MAACSLRGHRSRPASVSASTGFHPADATVRWGTPPPCFPAANNARAHPRPGRDEQSPGRTPGPARDRADRAPATPAGTPGGAPRDRGTPGQGARVLPGRAGDDERLARVPRPPRRYAADPTAPPGLDTRYRCGPQGPVRNRPVQSRLVQKQLAQNQLVRYRFVRYQPVRYGHVRNQPARHGAPRRVYPDAPLGCPPVVGDRRAPCPPGLPAPAEAASER